MSIVNKKFISLQVEPTPHVHMPIFATDSNLVALSVKSWSKLQVLVRVTLEFDLLHAVNIAIEPNARVVGGNQELTVVDEHDASYLTTQRELSMSILAVNSTFVVQHANRVALVEHTHACDKSKNEPLSVWRIHQR